MKREVSNRNGMSSQEAGLTLGLEKKKFGCWSGDNSTPPLFPNPGMGVWGLLPTNREGETLTAEDPESTGRRERPQGLDERTLAEGSTAS